jgi:hypothetical protein
MSAPITIPQKGFYIHYKHDPSGSPHNYTYEVVGLARNTEEKTYSVLYRPLYENDWFAPADFQARPLEMFLETVEIDGNAIPRFRLISDPLLIDKLNAIRDTMYPID